jgi:hypothetical protein
MKTGVCCCAAVGMVAMALTISCGKKDVEPRSAAPTQSAAPAAAAPAAAPLTPGMSKSLKRNPEPPFYNFDYLGPIHYPAVQKSPQVPGDDEVMITGWAADPSKKSLAGGVDIVIDGVPYSAGYGTDRSDVANHYNTPDLAKCGFQLRLARKQLTKGPHAASVRVIAQDKKSYNEGPTVQFTVI